MGLVIRGLYVILISTQMVEYPSFCFHADLVFQEKTSSLRECWILKSVNFSILHFACAQKLYPIYEHFQHPVYAHFIVVGM